MTDNYDVLEIVFIWLIGIGLGYFLRWREEKLVLDQWSCPFQRTGEAMKQIILKIKPNGDMQIRVNGACGPECQDLTRKVEEALGVVTDDTKTDEYYVTQEQAQEVNN